MYLKKPTQTAVYLLLLLLLVCGSAGFRSGEKHTPYQALYFQRIQALRQSLDTLIRVTRQNGIDDPSSHEAVRNGIRIARLELKRTDFWFRYLEPLSHKKLNGPLPVEWETEVFEKFEKPYRREGAGLTLAWQCLEAESPRQEEFLNLLNPALDALTVYEQDSVTEPLFTPAHFYFCNRLYLLNLATLYTTGFECPDQESVIPELLHLIRSTGEIYNAYNTSFGNYPLSDAYLQLYREMESFVAGQPMNPEQFDHYTFIREYVNPLYALNTGMIVANQVRSNSLVDYSLNKYARSIFSKDLYTAQNSKGIFHRVTDPDVLNEIEALGALLFFDPILSGNNRRSCASCHKPEQAFTDNDLNNALELNGVDRLSRNTPTLLNATYNHLLMADGKHYTLTQQIRGVLENPAEMGSNADEVVRKIMSCKTYHKRFSKLLKHTPLDNKAVTLDHLAAAITYYYSRFATATAPFDRAMHQTETLPAAAIRGFNLFMGKAQCGTCHFVPQFNGVKPPYIGSEFEVLGVPADSAYSRLSPDSGRYHINPAPETLRAFRTGTVRNAALTAPYMHNGVFSSLEQLIEFYNGGGGAGHGLIVPNQTLAADSLHLSPAEKQDLIAFIQALSEDVAPVAKPDRLPMSSDATLNTRIPGGIY